MPYVNDGLVYQVLYHLVGAGRDLRIDFAIDDIGIYCDKVHQCLFYFYLA